MKTWIQMILILIAGMLFTGCSFFAPIDFRAEVENDQVLSADPLLFQPPLNAKQVLYEAFSREVEGVPWLPSDKENAIKFLNAIDSTLSYMKNRTTLDGFLPYYVARDGFEAIQYYYMQLMILLDRRYHQGVLTEPEGVVYEYTRETIKQRLEVERIRMTQNEDSISAKASQRQLDQLKGLANTLEPIIGMIL